MNSPTSSLPPLPAAADLASFRDLLSLLADPKQAAARLKQIDASATAAQKVLADVNKGKAELEEFRSQVQLATDELRRRHEARLADELERHQQLIQQQTEQLNARDRSLSQREQEVAADEQRVGKLKAELERKARLLAE